MKRANDESYLSFVERACRALEDGFIGYNEWAEAVIGETMYSEENLRRCFQFFKKYITKLEEEGIEEINDEERLRAINLAKEELIKERKKLQTVNSEAQEYYRTLGRNELFNEKIVEAIKNLEPIKIDSIYHESMIDTITGLLCLSDLHAGSTFEIKGLYGEIVNQYNFDIMKSRLEKLTGYVISDCFCDKYVVAICGDLFENALRMTSLTKLREPVIDTVIKTSEFLCQWVLDFAEKVDVPVKVVLIGGNHDTCSFLGSKPRFEEENLVKIVAKFMELRFENVKDIEIVPYSDNAVINIYNTNILFEHGETQNLQEVIDYYSNLYNIDIDEIYSGHYHRPESKAIGITEYGDRMVYRVGSICGVDTYAKKLHKAARPSAYFAVYTPEEGHTWSRNIYL